jgi:transcriptional regulator with XRE-family HTH domain
LSQEDFAEQCGLHRTYIGQVERGEKNISFVNILRIAKGLRAKPSQLFEQSKL